MGTAQLLFAEVLWGATGSHVTGSDVSYVPGSDVSHCPEVCSAYAHFYENYRFIQFLLVIFLSWWVSNFHNQIYFT
jgi:hypothetical protein